MAAGEKDPGAFKTIGELSQELGVAQHILRYWESKFPQLKPLQRAGNRRYYRPADVDVARRIHRLLNHEGYTIRGVQKLLRNKDGEDLPAAAPSALAQPDFNERSGSTPLVGGPSVERLKSIHNFLADALQA